MPLVLDKLAERALIGRRGKGCRVRQASSTVGRANGEDCLVRLWNGSDACEDNEGYEL